MRRGVRLDRFERALASLDDVFIQAVREAGDRWVTRPWWRVGSCGARIGRKGYLISTAAVPVLLAIAVLVVVVFGDRIGGAAAEASAPDAGDAYGLIDHAGVLDGRDIPPTVTRFADEAAARAALSREAIAGYFVVAANYQESGAVRFVAADVRRTWRARGTTPEGRDPVCTPRCAAAGARGA